MSTTLSTTRTQARWMKPNASLWVHPDAARFYAPGTNLADVFPVLALKYSPNQPRVPSGNPDGGRWTDGAGGAGRLTQPMGRIGITDRRVGFRRRSAGREARRAVYAGAWRTGSGRDWLP